MLSDAAITILVSLVGLVVLALAIVTVAVRGKGNQAVIWKGFGVTFEIRPCRTCPSKPTS